MNFCFYKVNTIHLYRLVDSAKYCLEIMPLSAPGAQVSVRRGPKVKMQDHFAAVNTDKNAGEEEGDGDVIMNEDGTMYAAANASSEDEL